MICKKKRRDKSSYILNFAFDAIIPKKRWKKQALILITTNHAILVALVECLLRNWYWFVYVSRRAFNKRIRYISSRILHREIAARLFTPLRGMRAKKGKSSVEKSKYKLASIPSALRESRVTHLARRVSRENL